MSIRRKTGQAAKRADIADRSAIRERWMTTRDFRRRRYEKPSSDTVGARPLIAPVPILHTNQRLDPFRVDTTPPPQCETPPPSLQGCPPRKLRPQVHGRRERDVRRVVSRELCRQRHRRRERELDHRFVEVERLQPTVARQVRESDEDSVDCITNGRVAHATESTSCHARLAHVRWLSLEWAATGLALPRSQTFRRFSWC